MKKCFAFLLTLTMLFTLAVPAAATEPTVSGEKAGDVTASYTPGESTGEPTIDAVTIGDAESYEGAVAVDTENQIYTITVPEGEGYVLVSVTVSGRNLDKITEGDYRLMFTEGSHSTLRPSNYDSATGDLCWDTGVYATDVGSALQYSTDGGLTWVDTGWTVVIEKEEPAPTYVTLNAMLKAVDSEGSDVSGVVGYLDGITLMEDEISTYYEISTGSHTVTDFDLTTENGYEIPADIVLSITDADGDGLGEISTTSSHASVAMVDGVYVITVTLEAKTTEPETAEITGMSIFIDDVEYNSTNTSAENPAVMTTDTRSVTIKVTGTNLQNNETAIASYMPRESADMVRADSGWSISNDGTSASKDISEILDVFTKTIDAWELKYGNDGDTLESSGVYVKYQAPSYEVNIDADIIGGTVTVNPDSAEAGETVTVTVTAEAGYAYVVNSLKVTTDTTGETVAVDEENKTFVMPADDVTVTAEFEKLAVTSAEIAWGSMAFTYTDESGEWTADTAEDAGTVTVKNTGDTGITVTISYEATTTEYGEITGSFDAEDATVNEDYAYLEKDVDRTFTLTLSGEPSKAILAGTKIGQITIVIEQSTYIPV